jgi:hypothetical protein
MSLAFDAIIASDAAWHRTKPARDALFDMLADDEMWRTTKTARDTLLGMLADQEPVPLDPDLLSIARNATQQNIVQQIYALQAERNRSRQPLFGSLFAGDVGWKESQHPRGGDPENAGRFSSASGSGGGETPSKGAEPAPSPEPKSEPEHAGPAEPAPLEQRLVRTDLAAIPEPYARKGYRGGGSLRLRSDGVPVIATYEPDSDLDKALERIGADSATYHEFGPGQGEAFAKLIGDSARQTRYGAAVHVYDSAEYNEMRLFATPDGNAGFALHGDDIVSVFKAKGGPKNAVASVLALAVKLGGKRLDCFDTQLPELYSNAGFKAVARLKFDEQYAPPGWSYETFDHYNDGRPDVVGMVYDPNHEAAYKATDGAFVEQYDDIAAAQRDAIKGTGLAGSQGHEGLISTRRPTGAEAKAGDVDSDYYRRADLDAMRDDPDLMRKNMELLHDPAYYPNLRAEEVDDKTPDEVARAAIDHAKANLRFLYDTAPKELIESAHLWYEGAHEMAQMQAKTYDVPLSSAAGVFAALSPQKDWEQNVYLAEALIKIHQTNQNTRWNERMEETGQQIWKANPNLSPEKRAAKQAEFDQMLADIRGKTLGELNDPILKAAWIRTYDEATSDRSYQRLSPDGQPLGQALNDDGTPARAAWQALSAISNAVEALEANGDRATISRAMGDMHKVRSFYNNILDPHSPNRDVTMDTHAVGAALLRPLSSKDVPVLHSLSSSPPAGIKGASNSDALGIKGTYSLWADAYRELADELGIEPRVLQSATWEAKRRLFDENMSPTAKRAVDAAWHEYHDGQRDLSAVQKDVLSIAQKDQQRRAAAREKKAAKT